MKAPSNIRLHMLTHTGEKPFACTFCSYASNKKGNLQSHLKLRHGTFWGVAVEDTHGWEDTHRFKHTLFQYTCFQTYTIQIYIDRVIHYFSITGIWVYSIKIYKYLNLKLFRYMAVCIQTHIYSGITHIPTQIIQT